jgi:3,4-dihydroxy 2-butanone 4-phosphate synthase / GTP cyclohydrolase II
MNFKNPKVQQVIEDVINGKPIIIVDDYDRENEGDLMVAAEKATIENMAFIKREAGGLLCIPSIGEILDRLEIPMMTNSPTDPFGTPFTLSVDARDNATTGMSISDRLEVVKIFINKDSKPDQLVRPGHMFPLRAKPNLLQSRKGHTEASIEICKLANLMPVSLIIEIMNKDGTMSRYPDLLKLAETFNLNIISVEEICDEIYK